MALTQVSSGGIKDGSITNADLDSSAAIDGSKVSPDFGDQGITTTGTVTGAALIPSGNTVPTDGIYLADTNTVALSTNGTGRLFVDEDGRVSVGEKNTGTAQNPFQINTYGAAAVGLGIYGAFTSTGADQGAVHFYGAYQGANASLASIVCVDNRASGTASRNGELKFITSNASGNFERVRIDSSGRLGIGVNGPDSTLTVKAATGVTPFKVSGPSSEFAKIDTSGRLLVGTSSSSGNNASLQVRNDDSSANHIQALRSSDTAGAAPAISFARSRGTAASPAEVTTDDLLGTFSFVGYDGANWVAGASIQAYADGTWTDGGDTTSDTTTKLIVFKRNDGTEIGSVIRNGATTVNYATSSDYRLKENIKPLTGALAKFNTLKPSRFNFIGDTRTVDGFIAHEVQAIVPEAITGEKDAVDEDGNPVYQGIDQSKLVPLLTAALQEAVAKIESLEARLTAAGI